MRNWIKRARYKLAMWLLDGNCMPVIANHHDVNWLYIFNKFHVNGSIDDATKKQIQVALRSTVKR